MRFPKEGTRTWKVLYVIAIIIRPFFVRLTIEGEDNIPASGGCVIVCNHTLGADYVLLGYASPRQVFYMGKSEIFAFHPLLAKLLSNAGTFPVQRGKGDKDAIEQAVTIVKSGKIVGMFPEGTRSRTGQLQRAKSGAVRIAVKAQAPVVPAAVINGEPILRDFFKLQRRPLVKVRFGQPIMVEGDAEDPQAMQELTTTVMLALAELLPAERHGYYADAAAVERVRG